MPKLLRGATPTAALTWAFALSVFFPAYGVCQRQTLIIIAAGVPDFFCEKFSPPRRFRGSEPQNLHIVTVSSVYVPGCPRMHAGRCEFKSSDTGKPHTRPFADMPGHHPGAGGRQRQATGGLIPPLPPGQRAPSPVSAGTSTPALTHRDEQSSRAPAQAEPAEYGVTIGGVTRSRAACRSSGYGRRIQRLRRPSLMPRAGLPSSSIVAVLSQAPVSSLCDSAFPRRTEERWLPARAPWEQLGVQVPQGNAALHRRTRRGLGKDHGRRRPRG